jgi:hypothetical protein
VKLSVDSPLRFEGKVSGRRREKEHSSRRSVRRMSLESDGSAGARGEADDVSHQKWSFLSKAAGHRKVSSSYSSLVVSVEETHQKHCNSLAVPDELGSISPAILLPYVPCTRRCSSGLYEEREGGGHYSLAGLQGSQGGGEKAEALQSSNN